MTFNNNFFIYLAVCYPIFLILSNVSGFKLNYFVTFILLLFAFFHALKDSKVVIILIAASIIIFSKFTIFGSFSVKEMFVLLFGPLIFNRFISNYDKGAEIEKNKVLNLILLIGLFIVALVIMQYNSIIPMAIGNMQFLNVVGVTIFGELDDSFRPSAFFYHPYDTALSIIPLLSLSLIMIVQKRSFLGLTFLLLTCSAVFCLQLKIMYAFSFLVFFYALYFYRFVINKKVFLFIALLLAIQVIYVGSQEYTQEEIAFSAGRLIMWRLNIEEFFYNMELTKAIFGLDQNPLERSVLWSGDEFYSAHNLYLFVIVNTGFFFTILFIALKQMNLNKDKLVDFCILLMMLTFAYTGDLMVYISYWICISCIYVVSERTNKYF